MQTKKGKNSNNKKILVIGGVAAGSSAASKAKRIDPDADVIQDESVVSYGACGMPYVIEGINRRKGHSSEYISLLDIK